MSDSWQDGRQTLLTFDIEDWHHANYDGVD